MDPSQVDVVERLTRLAFEFGPFLFAILCVLWVTRKAYNYYNGACVAQPPVPPAEIKTHRIVYYGSWVFSALLVIASVTWWMANYRTIKVYKFSILDLTKDEFIVSPSTSIFLQSRQQSLPSGDGSPRQDVVLVVVSDGDIEKLAPFRIKYLNRISQRWTEFLVPYSNRTNYKIIDGKLELASNPPAGIRHIASRAMPRQLLWRVQYSGGISGAPGGYPSGMSGGFPGGAWNSGANAVTNERYKWNAPKYGAGVSVTIDKNTNVQRTIQLDHKEAYQILQQQNAITRSEAGSIR